MTRRTDRDPEMELLRQHKASGAQLGPGAAAELARYEEARGLVSPMQRAIEDELAKQTGNGNDRAIASMHLAPDVVRDRTAVTRKTDEGAAIFAALPLGERWAQLTYERAQELEKGQGG